MYLKNNDTLFSAPPPQQVNVTQNPMIINQASTTVCMEEAMRLAETLLHIDQLKHNEDGMMETTFG